MIVVYKLILFLATDYSVLIVQSKKFNSSYTSANPYMKLFGSLGESDVFAIPKNTFEFIISVFRYNFNIYYDFISNYN